MTSAYFIATKTDRIDVLVALREHTSSTVKELRAALTTGTPFLEIAFPMGREDRETLETVVDLLERMGVTPLVYSLSEGEAWPGELLEKQIIRNILESHDLDARQVEESMAAENPDEEDA